MSFLIGMHSPGEPIITSASPGDPYSIGKDMFGHIILYHSCLILK